MDAQGPKEWPEWPFCGKRCRLVDLGRWLGGSYRIESPAREEDLDDADMVVTLKAQERRQPRRLRDAQARGIPFYIVRSNTIVQMENFLRAAFGVDDHPSLDEVAVREVEEAVDEVLELGRPVELSPQNNHLRRLQHELVERFGLSSESKGQEPYRRVVVFPERVAGNHRDSASP